MRFKLAWAAPESGAPISTSTSSPTSPRWPSLWPGGIPAGATVCTNEVARAFHAGMHGTTFGGGPFACAVAIAVIDAIERDHLLDHVIEIGDYFQEQLHKLAERHHMQSSTFAAAA